MTPSSSADQEVTWLHATGVLIVYSINPSVITAKTLFSAGSAAGSRFIYDSKNDN
jgi:hypothetical protein